MTRLAWFNSFSGISGDMALGALIDAGADVAEVRDMLRRLPADGGTLDAAGSSSRGPNFSLAAESA